VSGFLRLAGILNIAVWLGAAVFFNVSVGPAFHSEAMSDLLGPKSYPYFSPAVEQILAARLFHLQIACGVMALLHVLAEWLYSGRSPQKRWLALLVAVLAIALTAGGWLEPKLAMLHNVRYGGNAGIGQRENAARAFSAWQQADRLANLLVIAGVAVYLWGVVNPPDPTRFVSAAKFRS
jgi:hypothetical protein